MSVRLPVLLDGDMHETVRLRPETLELSLSLTPLSSAVMTLPPGEMPLAAGDFVAVFPPGGEERMIFRVTETETDFGALGAQRVHLEHGLGTLADHAIFGVQAFQGLDTGGESGSVRLTGLVHADQYNTVNLREGPSKQTAVLCRVPLGDTVVINGATGVWYAVTWGGYSGWMMKEFVTVQETPQQPQQPQQPQVQIQELREVLDSLLTDHQDGEIMWVLDACEVEKRNGYTFDNCNLLEAVLSTLESVEEPCAWSFDQSSLPWRLSLRYLSDDTACELRLGRSLEGVRISVDRSGLCTRLYPVGKDGLTIEPINGGLPYVEAETAQRWGVVSRIYHDENEENLSSLKAAAQKALSERCEPVVTVEMSALDLYAVTGEPMDRIQLGMMCRVPLPRWKTSVRSRVIAITWKDALHAPERAEVTLANRQPSADSLLADLFTARRAIF